MTLNEIEHSKRYPYRARLFQSFAWLGVRGPDAKNQGYYQPIEMKLCMSHYSHKSMSDAKFKPGRFSILEI